MAGTAPVSERVQRERRAYDENSVDDQFLRWYRRAGHVLRSPNTLRGEERWRALLRDAARGARALDVGCGVGWNSRQVLDFGADYVLGVDLSESQLAEARQNEIPLRLDELRWFERRFANFELVPINYFTYPAGIFSSVLLKRPDNALMRAADR